MCLRKRAVPLKRNKEFFRWSRIEMPQEHLRNQQDPMHLPPNVRNAEPIIWVENQGLQLKRTCRGIHSSGFISQWWSTQPFRGCCRHGPNVLGYYFCRQQTPWSSCDTDFTSMLSARDVGLGRLPPRFQWMIWAITQEVPEKTEQSAVGMKWRRR